jgi:hypothetical protein
MIDAKRLLDELVGSGVAGGLAGGLAGGSLTGLLSGKKGKKARKLAGSAAKLGGVALVGGLAYKAWQSYQQGRQPEAPAAIEPPPSGSAFLPAAGDVQGDMSLGLLLARAMIAAAKADGRDRCPGEPDHPQPDQWPRSAGRGQGVPVRGVRPRAGHRWAGGGGAHARAGGRGLYRLDTDARPALAPRAHLPGCTRRCAGSRGRVGATDRGDGGGSRALS